ncbi:hypothetical protein EVAR_51868_1 [Eumeta japonica]|uniref:Uncharacterized protein n=1 Tax=Eumeta variegata TaxID=151549 RepID=A0A4C1YSI9_EUMVA|nr:hypothetical protein EVAR_51868_1 [Eumeta japonica]
MIFYNNSLAQPSRTQPKGQCNGQCQSATASDRDRLRAPRPSTGTCSGSELGGHKQQEGEGRGPVQQLACPPAAPDPVDIILQI